MNTIAKRAKILYIIVAVFAAGLVFLAATFIVNGDTYATNTRNQHIYSGNVLISGGRVLDRNGEVLTAVENGSRVYNTDSVIRRATLHVLGESGYIAGGVLEQYSAELIGYNLITGVFTATEQGGNDVRLTLDASLCADAYRALDGQKGTVGVYNYQTGELVCMVSTPAYDPENKPADIDENEDYDGAYLNKFLYGQYVPGSTFKVVTAVCAVENMPDVLTRTFSCTGEYNAADGTVICNDTHGTLTFQQAFNQSCNSVFAQLADELGAEKMTATAQALGVTESLAVNRLNTAKGSYDVSGASHADLGWSGIGQYTDMVNPCNMMTLAGAIANGGKAVTPYLIAFTIFTGIPFISAFALSFLDVKFITRLDDVHFVGIKNFVRFFSSKEALAALGRSGLYTLIYVPVIMILSFILAYLLNKGVFWAKGIRSMFFLPYVSNMVAVAVVFQLMLGPRGPFYLLQKFFGVEDPIIPLLNQKWALPVVVLIAVWKGIGLNFLTYLGALQNVDKSQVEAAEIDGANKWQQIKNVVIPAVAPTTFFLTISSIITSLQNFTVIQSLTDGGPGQATTVMSLSIVNTAFVKYETSYASAQALVMFGIVMIITLIQWCGQKKWADQ